MTEENNWKILHQMQRDLALARYEVETLRQTANALKGKVRIMHSDCERLRIELADAIVAKQRAESVANRLGLPTSKDSKIEPFEFFPTCEFPGTGEILAHFVSS